MWSKCRSHMSIYNKLNLVVRSEFPIKTVHTIEYLKVLLKQFGQQTNIGFNYPNQHQLVDTRLLK